MAARVSRDGESGEPPTVRRAPALPIRLGLSIAEQAKQAAVVEVLWPSGQESRLRDVPANQVLRITEPEAVP